MIALAFCFVQLFLAKIFLVNKINVPYSLAFKCVYYNYIYNYSVYWRYAFPFFTYGLMSVANVRINTLLKSRDEHFQHS